MPIAWFLIPYERDIRIKYRVVRRCLVDDYGDQIRDAGGVYHGIEILGNVALVKINSPQTIIDIISVIPGAFKLPKVTLTDSLSDLTIPKKNAIVNKLKALGYSTAEIQTALGTDISTKTFGDLLRFAATRRLSPRYDSGTDTIFMDGPIRPCNPIEMVDK